MIVPQDKFKSLQFRFSCEEDPVTKAPIDLTFTALDFTEVKSEEAAENLVKFAAFKKIQQLGAAAE